MESASNDNIGEAACKVKLDGFHNGQMVGLKEVGLNPW